MQVNLLWVNYTLVLSTVTDIKYLRFVVLPVVRDSS